MKKLISLILAATMLLVSACALAEAADAYTTASATKAVLSGDELTAAEAVLQAKSSLLSTSAEAKAEGYAAKEGTGLAQILSVNADGSVGLSTISEWKYEAGKVSMKLTQGQNALNLAEAGKTGTLLVGADGAWYLLHLVVTDVEVLEYSDAAFEAGEFDQFYSGAAAKLNEYHINCDVPTIECSHALMF